MKRVLAIALLLVLATPATAADDLQAHPKLSALVAWALEHGLGRLREAGRLQPTLVVESAGKRGVQRFRNRDQARALGEAQTAAAALEPSVERYALLYDALIPVDGRRVDAVVVDAAERDGGEAWRIVQRYRPRQGSDPLATIGKPLLVGREKNLLAPGGGGPAR